MNKLTLIDILKERKAEREKYFQNYLAYAKKIKEKAKKILGNCRVYIFGSIIKNSYHPILSDIDILIVSNLFSKEKKSEIKREILSGFPAGVPFEIHLVCEEDYKNWYSKFISEKLEV